MRVGQCVVATLHVFPLTPRGFLFVPFYQPSTVLATVVDPQVVFAHGELHVRVRFDGTPTEYHVPIRDLHKDMRN